MFETLYSYAKIYEFIYDIYIGFIPFLVINERELGLKLPVINHSLVLFNLSCV